MTAGWNFERRRDACARLLIGVWMLAKGLPERDTSLEAVRSRTRLTPEEALFAARRSSDEHLITFEEGGAIRSNARGIERARALIDAVRAKVERFDDVVKTLDSAGAAAVLACVVRAEGGTLACGAPSSDPDGTYRLALVGDAVMTERRLADGTFERVEVGSAGLAAMPFGQGGTGDRQPATGNRRCLSEAFLFPVSCLLSPVSCFLFLSKRLSRSLDRPAPGLAAMPFG